MYRADKPSIYANKGLTPVPSSASFKNYCQLSTGFLLACPLICGSSHLPILSVSGPRTSPSTSCGCRPWSRWWRCSRWCSPSWAPASGSRCTAWPASASWSWTTWCRTARSGCSPSTRRTRCWSTASSVAPSCCCPHPEVPSGARSPSRPPRLCLRLTSCSCERDDDYYYYCCSASNLRLLLLTRKQPQLPRPRGGHPHSHWSRWRLHWQPQNWLGFRKQSQLPTPLIQDTDVRGDGDGGGVNDNCCSILKPKLLSLQGCNHQEVELSPRSLNCMARLIQLCDGSAVGKSKENMASCLGRCGRGTPLGRGCPRRRRGGDNGGTRGGYEGEEVNRPPLLTTRPRGHGLTRSRLPGSRQKKQLVI